MGVANYGKIKTLHDVFVKNFIERELFKNQSFSPLARDCDAAPKMDAEHQELAKILNRKRLSLVSSLWCKALAGWRKSDQKPAFYPRMLTRCLTRGEGEVWDVF